MSDPNAGLPADMQPSVEDLGRNSPASATCYATMEEAQEQSAHDFAPAAIELPFRPRHDAGWNDAAVPAHDEADNTLRSEVPSSADVVSGDSQQVHGEPEPGYFFSPRPLRPYGSRLPTSASASTEPSPTTSANASTTSVNGPFGHSEHSFLPTDQQGRPGYVRDYSNNSTNSVATVRAHTVDPQATSTPPSKSERDGPHFPNQSYAALQSQHYPVPYGYPGRTRSLHPSHLSSHSVSHTSAFGFPYNYHNDIMDTGSRTAGNSPATSPGLFNPSNQPPRHGHDFDDGSYSSLYLHHTHRQAPKETHVADVDFDPISGRKIINQYEILDELGRGVHGKVKLGKSLRTDETVAIKIVDRYPKRRRLGRNTSQEDKIKREIAILKKARHPNIVSLIEVIDDPTRKKVYIVLEHLRSGEVRWRTEGEKEITLLEWRRHQRESQGIYENESAQLEDDKILNLAQKKIARGNRRRMKRTNTERLKSTSADTWSLEHGGESEDDLSEGGGVSKSSSRDKPSRHGFTDRWIDQGRHEYNMETAIPSGMPAANVRKDESSSPTGLEGTMYGAYEPDFFQGRTSSTAGSSSSHLTDDDNEVPEHFGWVPSMTLQAAREAFRDTLLGLEYLHYQGVIHRDIKPANLLQTEQHRIKISDFGVSYLGRPVHDESNGEHSETDMQDLDEAIELAKTVGTPAFYAPELCRTDLEGEVFPVNHQIDIWALGVTLYCLVYGRVPFHDHNTFHLMKLISDEEVHIPKWRLKAVAETGSRPNSHGRMPYSLSSNKRAPHDLEYEAVDDELRDLIKRLLIKDPRNRITVREIKVHPWLGADLDNLSSWIEETDPGRALQGRRIEVSKDDVEKAVVPATFADRVKTGVRKTLETVLKLGGRGGSRRRAQSTASNQDQSNISAHSSSSTMSQEGRRPSLALNQSIFEALSRSREPEHPLSQSVTASPAASEKEKFFEGSNSRTASPAHSLENKEHIAPLFASARPAPERAHSAMSSAASVRTVRQTDLTRNGRSGSPCTPPALPGTPTALDTPGGSNLGGLFGGVSRRVINSMRSRERMLKPPQEHSRAKSIDRLINTDDDAHAGPSIALSTTFAAGRVDLKELSPTLARSRSPNFADIQHPDPLEQAPSRHSSTSSTSSYYNRAYAAQDRIEVDPTRDLPSHWRSSYYRETSLERITRAKDENRRKRVLEDKQRKERPTSALVQSACPPSPDDDDYWSRGEGASTETALPDLGPQSRDLVSSSSEDHFASISQSTSNPSILSIATANSSLCGAAPATSETITRLASPVSDSPGQLVAAVDDSPGYDGDGDRPGDSNDLMDSDDSSDEGLVMGKRKSVQPFHRSGSISNAELARSNIHNEIMSNRRRSRRSGSNGTVKKIPPPYDPSNDAHE
jgi:serine/threonine protein kinase